MKKTWKLSASFFSSFKACAFRCYAKYVCGIVPDTDTDALRQGTNWHAIQEIMGFRPETVCPVCAKGQKDPDCPLCEGTDILPAEMMDAVIRHLNKVYADIPLYKTKEEWLKERAVLLYSLAGYNWHYPERYEVLAEEIEFDLPVRNPATGRALPNVRLVGKIDKIYKDENGHVFIGEHKSTSKGVDSDSTYWGHLRLDVQTTLYPYAARVLQLEGKLEQYGIKATDPLISSVLYDVWHKPGISLKRLTQADSKKFVETGEYMGDKFEVADNRSLKAEIANILINNERAEVEPGAKEGTFAIRETPDMFGARLLRDISERPEFYFARKEISRTDADFTRLENEIYNIYHTVKFMDKNETWWKNEQQCEATFRCPLINVCYNNITLDPQNPPEGFKSRFKKQEKKEND